MNRHSVLSPSGLSRRAALGRVAAVGAALGLGGRLGRATAQEATPPPVAGHPIVGTWVVDRNPGEATDPPTAVVFTADGGWIDPVLGVAGVWVATGPRAAAWTAIGLVDGGAGGYFALRTSGEIDEAGTTFAGTGTVTIVAPDGTVRTTLAGGPPSHGVRLRFEPVAAAGTAFSGVPAWTPAPPPAATPTA